MFFNCSTISPDLCISNKMSHPPTNSPSKKTCGIVGQLVNSLMPTKQKDINVSYAERLRHSDVG